MIQADAPGSFQTAVLALLAHLDAAAYRFVTPNRSTHATVRRRRPAAAEDLLRDVFGWVRPVEPGRLPRTLETELLRGGVLVAHGSHLLTRIRVSSVGALLFAHSAPGAGQASVFLGPDSYRYARFLDQTLGGRPPVDRSLDVGVGAGVGALTLLRSGFARSCIGSDINARALELARLNAANAGLDLQTVECSGLPDAPASFDLIVANPPFIAGAGGALYRDGGELYGAALSLAWARAAVDRLAPRGRFVLYTGAPVVGGMDLVQREMSHLADRPGFALTYEEIDPDIFGESLKGDAYRDVERIAAVGAVLTRA